LNIKPEELKHVERAPILFRLAKIFQRMRIRGGYRYEGFLRKWRCLNYCVRYTLPNNVSLDIPISERSYDYKDIIKYELDSIEQITPIIANYNHNFCLLDCGADIGLMSAKFVSAFSQVKEVISFEPNYISFQYLERNIILLGVEAKAFNMGVGDFNGKAELHFPSFDLHDHAAYVVPSKNGDFQVVTIDSLDLQNGDAIFLKVDVEGAELAVIKGAHDTIAAAEHFIILFEAHPKQVQRVGIDPIEIISYVNAIRKCKVKVMQSPNFNLDLNNPFFDQLPNKIYDVCIYT